MGSREWGFSAASGEPRDLSPRQKSTSQRSPHPHPLLRHKKTRFEFYLTFLSLFFYHFVLLLFPTVGSGCRSRPTSVTLTLVVGTRLELSGEVPGVFIDSDRLMVLLPALHPGLCHRPPVLTSPFTVGTRGPPGHQSREFEF